MARHGLSFIIKNTLTLSTPADYIQYFLMGLLSSPPISSSYASISFSLCYFPHLNFSYFFRSKEKNIQLKREKKENGSLSWAVMIVINNNRLQWLKLLRLLTILNRQCHEEKKTSKGSHKKNYEKCVHYTWNEKGIGTWCGHKNIIIKKYECLWPSSSENWVVWNKKVGLWDAREKISGTWIRNGCSNLKIGT